MVRLAEPIVPAHPRWRTYATALDDFITLQRVHGVGPARAEWILAAFGTLDAFLAQPPATVSQGTGGRISARFSAHIQCRLRRIDRPSRRRDGGRTARGAGAPDWRGCLTAVDDFLALQRVRGIGPRRAEAIVSAYGCIGAFLADTPAGVCRRTGGRVGTALAGRLQLRVRRLGLGMNLRRMREALESQAPAPRSHRFASAMVRAAEAPPAWLRKALTRWSARAAHARGRPGGWTTAPTAHG